MYTRKLGIKAWLGIGSFFSAYLLSILVWPPTFWLWWVGACLFSAARILAPLVSKHVGTRLTWRYDVDASRTGIVLVACAQFGFAASFVVRAFDPDWRHYLWTLAAGLAFLPFIAILRYREIAQYDRAHS